MKKEIIATLTRPFDRNLIKYRQGHDGKQLAYLPVKHYVDRLNEAFDQDWSFELTAREIVGEQIVVEVRLTAAGLTKTGLGGSTITRNEENKTVIALADDLKTAEADALKRACRLLGIGGELYADDQEDGVISRPSPATGNGNNHDHRPVGFPSPTPTPLPPRERLTSAQLNAIRAIAKKQGLDPSVFRQSIKGKFGIELEYLTRSQASTVISMLDANRPSNGNGSHHAWAG